MSQPQIIFTKSQQYYRVTILGVCFMMMFTAFNSLENMVSKLYDDYGYQNLGQTALLFIYFAFSINNIFTSYIVKHVGYKKTMFFSSIGYAVFQATGFLIIFEVNISPLLVWIIVSIGSLICGASASTLWVAQGAYTSRVATSNRKNQLFGLFMGLFMCAQIFGNLLITYILGSINNQVYFIIMITLGSLSPILFLFLPDVEIKKQTKQLNLKDQMEKVYNIVKDKKYKYLNMYGFVTGSTVAFYAGFLYKLVRMSLPQQSNEDSQVYLRRINEHAGYIFFTLGISEICTGFLMNRFSEKYNKFKLATIGGLLLEFTGFVSFLCYYVKSYKLCLVAALLWGTTETFLQTNIGGITSQVFPGKVQGFSVYRIFNAIGTVFVLFTSIVLSNWDEYIFLIIVIVLQTFTTAISLNLRYLQFPQVQSQQKKYLLMKKQTDITLD